MNPCCIIKIDFCYGNPSRSPEGTVQRIYDAFDINENTRIALDYYIINGCRGDYSQKNAVDDLIFQLNEATTSAMELKTLVAQNQQQFENMCSGQPGSLDPLLEMLSLALDAFDDVTEIGFSTSDLLTCEGINTIWVNIAHDAMCTSAPDAFAWMFSSIMLVYVSGMFIYLLRGALLPSTDLNDDYNTDEYHDDDEGVEVEYNGDQGVEMENHNSASFEYEDKLI